MKKLFLILLFTAGVYGLWSQGEVLLSDRLYLDTPRVHKVEPGEYLSKLAQQYYGDPQRWRELALVNRAPNPNHVEVGEEILLPAANVVAEIARARTLSQVNQLTAAQAQIAERGTPAPAAPAETAVPAPTIEPASPEPLPAPVQEPVTRVDQDGSSSWLWWGLGLLALVLVAGVIIYRRRRAEQMRHQDGTSERKDEETSRPYRPLARYTHERAGATSHRDATTSDSPGSERDDSRTRREPSGAVSVTPS